MLSLLVIALCSLLIRAANRTCRFAPLYTFDQLVADPSDFIDNVMYWEGQFHQNSVGYNTANGMTYDGTLLNGTTGEHNVSGLHPFSASSKESLQIMVYAHVLAGDPLAERFVSPKHPSQAKNLTLSILSRKLETYLQFNKTFPGYGGFLPWFYSNETDIRPTSDWVNRVPALDNGELLWAAAAAVQTLQDCGEQDLAGRWQAWLDYTKTTAATIFYNGTGRVCAVTTLQNQSLDVSAQNYVCEGANVLNDPYEGELFTWWLYFYGGLSDSDRNALWVAKRPQFVAVNYTGSVVSTSPSDSSLVNYTGASVVNSSPAITVQKGFWFSAHEQWKILEMPYLDVPLVYRVFHNAERVRTCNSVLMQNPGLFASVNNITDASGQIIGYISAAGIPSISNQTSQELDVITPYGAFPTVLFNQTVGLAWYKNMLDARAMQNPYGSTESTRRDGNGVSAFVSWDSKITTVNALLGGVSDYVRGKLQQEGLYDEFIRITKREHEMVFQTLVGEDVDLCLPQQSVPVTLVQDFTLCS